MIKMSYVLFVFLLLGCSKEEFKPRELEIALVRPYTFQNEYPELGIMKEFGLNRGIEVIYLFTPTKFEVENDSHAVAINCELNPNYWSSAYKVVEGYFYEKEYLDNKEYGSMNGYMIHTSSFGPRMICRNLEVGKTYTVRILLHREVIESIITYEDGIKQMTSDEPFLRLFVYPFK